MASLAFVALVLVYGVASPDLRLSRRLGFSALVLAASFLILPQMIFASAYADMRLTPYLFAVALLALRLRRGTDLRTGHLLAALGILFFAARTVADTASLAIAARDQSANLKAIDVIPAGARVASFYGLPEAEPWSLPRDSHLGGLVIARRGGFSNDQWITAGHNLLVFKYREAGSFASDPSEVVRPKPARTADTARSTRRSPRSAGQVRFYLADQRVSEGPRPGEGLAAGVARSGQHSLPDSQADPPC